VGTQGAQGHVVALNEAAVEEGFPRLIVDGLAMQARGWEQRRKDVLALAAQGLRPGKIAAELERRARAAGYSDKDLRCMGISEHNVRAILKREKRRVAA
jgi:hypothetical protein